MHTLCINSGSIARVHKQSVLANMTMKPSDFDAADYLLNESDIEVYLTVATEDDDSELLTAALGDIVRARRRIQADVTARQNHEA